MAISRSGAAPACLCTRRTRLALEYGARRSASRSGRRESAMLAHRRV